MLVDGDSRDRTPGTDSEHGLGGYHGSVHVTRSAGVRETVYYAVAVHSEGSTASSPSTSRGRTSARRSTTSSRKRAPIPTSRTRSGPAARRRGDGCSAGTRARGGEIGDIPMAEAHGDVELVMKEVPLADGSGTAPIQLMWSNAVRGPEGPISPCAHSDAVSWTRVGAAAGQHRGAAAGARGRPPRRASASGEAVGQPCGEAVAAAVGVLDGPGQRRGPERAARPHPAAEPARGRDDDLRRRVERRRARSARLRRSPLPTSTSSSSPRAASVGELARGRDEDARTARRPQRCDVAADEVDGVAARELLPRQRRVVARRTSLRRAR